MEFEVNTKKREEILDITQKVKALIRKNKVREGICLVWVPHATAGLTLLESADPNVGLDFLEALRKIAPKGIWKHDKIDQNGDAHIKSALVGTSVCIPVVNGNLALGTWQSIALCEFDGPRTRKVVVQIK